MKLFAGKTDAMFYSQVILSNLKGEVRKFIPKPNNESTPIREVYFSKLLPNEHKKWKCNKRQMQNITVAYGAVVVICIGARDGGFVYEEFLIDLRSNYGVLEIPAGTIYGFFANSEGAVIVNALEDFYQAYDSVEVVEVFDLRPTRL